MLRGRSSRDQSSVGTASVWGHRSHIKQGGVHSPQDCVCFRVRAVCVLGCIGNMGSPRIGNSSCVSKRANAGSSAGV